MVIMTIFDCYKLITETPWNYLIFLAMLAIVYLFVCMVLNYVTDCICKIIIACRAPMVVPRPPANPDAE